MNTEIFIEFGQKTDAYPYGYGYCQCGCSMKTAKLQNGNYATYYANHHPVAIKRKDKQVVDVQNNIVNQVKTENEAIVSKIASFKKKTKKPKAYSGQRIDEIRLRLSQVNQAQISVKAQITEIDLLRDYRRVELELGRKPNSKDIDEFGKFHSSTYARRYGSWSNFKKVMGDLSENKLSKEELITNYYNVKNKLGRIPTGEELAKYGAYGKRTYHKYFGGYRKLLELLEEK